MLAQFSVENFLSFDGEQIFSMVAGKSDAQHPAHLVPGDDNKGGTLLRAAALYGPNGSGKSNLVQALRFAQRLIVDGVRGEQSLGVRPFRLGGKQEGKLTKFEFVVRTDGKLYNYGFRLDNRRVHEEWLFATLNKKEVPLFERTTAANGNVKVTPGPSLRGKTDKQKQFLEFIADGMRPNQLFLTEAHERKVTQLKPVMDWFQNTLTIIPAEAQVERFEIEAQKDKSLVAFLSEVLQSAGTGIQSFETKEIPTNFDDLQSQFPDMRLEALHKAFSEADKPEPTVGIALVSGKTHFVRQKTDGKIVTVRFNLLHQGADGQTIPFTLEEESDGTQRLIHLIPALFMLRRQAEKTIILDELDRRFHTHLSRMFLRLALDCDAEHTRSQLIFTTHDTNLLDLDLLRRDEIWFVEKDKRGASHLYGLSEFNIRPDLKIEKGYLNGRFGAIPFISDIGQLGWTASAVPEESVA